MVVKDKERLVSVREAATECGRNMETVRRWIWSGELPAEKLGNQLFVRMNDLQAFCQDWMIKRRLTVAAQETATAAVNLKRRKRLIALIGNYQFGYISHDLEKMRADGCFSIATFILT